VKWIESTEKWKKRAEMQFPLEQLKKILLKKAKIGINQKKKIELSTWKYTTKK
jgi:hypothetical protein